MFVINKNKAINKQPGASPVCIKAANAAVEWAFYF